MRNQPSRLETKFPSPKQLLLYASAGNLSQNLQDRMHKQFPSYNPRHATHASLSTNLLLLSTFTTAFSYFQGGDSREIASSLTVPIIYSFIEGSYRLFHPRKDGVLPASLPGKVLSIPIEYTIDCAQNGLKSATQHAIQKTSSSFSKLINYLFFPN